MPSEKLQNKILKKLNAFGDSLLDETGDFSKKSQKHKKKDKQVDAVSVSEKRKKKRKKTKSNPEEQTSVDLGTQLKGKERHLAEIRQKLGLDEWELGCREATEETGPVQKKSKHEPEVIVFEDPAKRKQKRLAEAAAKITAPTSPKSRVLHKKEDGDVIFDLHRARHEVKRYGIGGLDKLAKEEAQVQLAIKLGAKPLPKLYVNYKQLLETNRKQKEQQSERSTGKDDNILNAASDGKSKKGKQRKRDRLSGVDGQIGLFKNGALKISEEDIKKIKKK